MQANIATATWCYPKATVSLHSHIYCLLKRDLFHSDLHSCCCSKECFHRVQNSNEPWDSQAFTNQGRIAALVYHILQWDSPIKLLNKPNVAFYFITRPSIIKIIEQQQEKHSAYAIIYKPYVPISVLGWSFKPDKSATNWQVLGIPWFPNIQ